MDFPEISFDTYDSWDAIPLPESHEYESSNIDSNMAQAVFEDVCFSDNAPEKKKTNDLGFDKISIDSTANFVIDPLTGISTTHSLEQPNCFTSSNAPGSESSSMSAVLKLGTYSGSKRKPAILVVNDNSVSSSGRRGPPGGDPNSKNAIAARDNRLKKKKYIADLENTVRELQSENDQLRKETEIKKQSMISLQLEVQYLKNVIANQSTLSALLKSVSQTPGINLSASISQPSASQHQNTLPLEVSSEALPSVSNGIKKKKILRSGSRKRQPQLPTVSTIQSKPKQCKKKYSASRIVKNRVYSEEKTTNEADNQEVTVNVVDSVTVSDSCSESIVDQASVQTENCSPSGICFHVSGNKVSLELCSYCNSSVLLDHSYVK